MPRLLLSLFLCCLASTAMAGAQGTRYLSFSNGTGFYVTKDGYIVTNAHVVRACAQDVWVQNRSTRSLAKVIVRNDAIDLALLKSSEYAPAVSALRSPGQPVRPKEKVIVMGYAGAAGRQGTYSFVTSEVIDAIGPTGEKHWLQFANAAQKGNSGGPLLDVNGHVIGVITGKTQLFRTANRAGIAPTKIGESDVAVNLDTLNDFLAKQGVRPQREWSGWRLSDNRIEYDAQNFIVQLVCQTN